MKTDGIDPSTLLTMLSLFAAVWAIVPNATKLSFRLSLNSFGWLVIWVTLLIIHGFYFEPVFTSLGFPILGTWLWGFDKSSTQYLLFLLLAAFIYWRSRRTKLTRWNIGLFGELATSLLHAGKHEELTDLLKRHLNSALDLAEPKTIRRKMANIIGPNLPNLTVVTHDDGSITLEDESPASRLFQRWFTFRKWLADVISSPQRMERHAASVIKGLLSSRPLIWHLAIARPYLCLVVMERATSLEEAFQDEFFNALLANEASILYSELKNNQNIHIEEGHRFNLPAENRLIGFYCNDVNVAARLGVYRSVGEAVLDRIDADENLEKKLNGRLLSFKEVGKYHDPVYAGINFFRIMVLEGLHQRIADHLWLHYMPHFARSLVDRAREIRPGDENHEFATPLAYLLYEVVDATTDWVRDAAGLTNPDEELNPHSLEGDHIYISFQAAEAISRVIHPVLMSPRMPNRLKQELLSVVLTTLANLEQEAHLAPLAKVMRESLITPYGSKEQNYLYALKQCFDEQDHVLRGRLHRLNDELNGAIRAAL